CVICFFFQAEDGIRDDLVTGVQTCALPIYGCPAGPAASRSGPGTAGVSPTGPRRPRGSSRRGRSGTSARRWCRRRRRGRPSRAQIGRASCREGGEVEGGRGGVNEQRGEAIE